MCVRGVAESAVPPSAAPGLPGHAAGVALVAAAVLVRARRRGLPRTRCAATVDRPGDRDVVVHGGAVAGPGVVGLVAGEAAGRVGQRALRRGLGLERVLPVVAVGLPGDAEAQPG